MSKDIEYGKLSKCKACGEAMPPIGRHLCSPSYAELKAQLEKQQLDNIDMQAAVASAGALLIETEAELEKHQWISVEDRLPEDDYRILVYFIDRIELATFFTHRQLGDVFNTRGCFWDTKGQCLFDDGIDRKPITHWKPITLPE